MTTRLYKRDGGAADADLTDITDITPFFDDNTSLIELGMSCQNGAASQGHYMTVDPTASMVTSTGLWVPPHTLVRLTEDAAGCEYWLAQGRVSGGERGRGDVVGADNIEHHWVVDDSNIDLTGLAFTEDWVRPEETDTERLYALQDYILNASSSTSPTFRPSTLIIVADSHLAPDTNTTAMPAKTYPAGTQPKDVVDDCASSAGKIYGVVIHHGSGDSATFTEQWRWDFEDGNSNDTTNTLDSNLNYESGSGFCPNGSACAYNDASSHLSDEFAVTPGTQIRVSLDVRWRFDPSSRNIFVRWYNSSHAWLGIDTNIIVGAGHSTGVTYSASTLMDVPAGAVFGRWDPGPFAGTHIDNVVIETQDDSTECSHLCLLYILENDHTTYATPIKISDQLENWTPDDFSAPVLEPHWDQGMSVIKSDQSSISGLVSRYGQGDNFLYINDAAQEDAYEVWIDSYDDSDSQDVTQATARATAIRTYRASGDATFQPSIILHPEQTPLITAGMSLQIDTAAILGGYYRGTYVNMRVVGINWEPRIDGKWMAHLQLNRGLRRMPASRGRLAPAATTPSDAATLPYNPATSGMGATNMQDAADELDDRVDDLELGQPVRKNSTGTVFTRNRLNLIEGSNVTLTVADDSPNDEVDITIAATVGSTTLIIQEDDSTVESVAATLDFGNGLDVTSSPSGEANIVVDPSEIKLDDLGAPDDNTDRDASTSAHGLMKKYPGGGTTFLRDDGVFASLGISGTPGASLGFMAYAYPQGLNPTTSGLAAASLPANGGSRTCPIDVSEPMYLDSVTVWNTDTGTARTWGWDLYYQNNPASATCTRVATGASDQTFTPSVASKRTIAAASAPVLLSPGLYWLVIQNRHATNTFGIGVVSTGSFALNASQSKTTTNPNGATLDLSTSWTRLTSQIGAVLQGRVFNEGALF